jgi:hypothetical protein
VMAKQGHDTPVGGGGRVLGRQAGLFRMTRLTFREQERQIVRVS